MKPEPLVCARAAERARAQPRPQGHDDAAPLDRQAHRQTGRPGNCSPALGPRTHFIRRRALLLWAALPALAQAEVEVNTASRARLESLPGLGPALVQRLLAARPFGDWADLMERVPGIRAATARKLSDAGLRVAGQAFSKPA